MPNLFTVSSSNSNPEKTPEAAFLYGKGPGKLGSKMLKLSAIGGPLLVAGGALGYGYYAHQKGLWPFKRSQPRPDEQWARESATQANIESNSTTAKNTKGGYLMWVAIVAVVLLLVIAAAITAFMKWFKLPSELESDELQNIVLHRAVSINESDLAVRRTNSPSGEM